MTSATSTADDDSYTQLHCRR